MKKAKMYQSLFIVFAVLYLVLPFSQAKAQNCDTVYEMIAQLRQPPIGAFNLWDTLHGDIDKAEVFKGIAPSVSSRDVTAFGEVFQNEGSQKKLFAIEVDKRGRSVWEKLHEVKGLQSVKNAIAHNGNYIVLATIENKNKRQEAWIGFLDKNGNIFFNKKIKRGRDDLEAVTMSLSSDEKHLIIIGYTKPKELATPPSTVMYWMDLKTKRITRDRLFAFGAENRINALRPMEYGDGYWGTGYIRAADGRMAGWVLQLNKQGGLMWQRQLSRGLGGRFFDVAEMVDGNYLVAVGEAFAADETRRRSAWVVALEANGEDIAWQRYYREDHALRANSVITHDDGQISVLISANNSENEDDKDYVRLLSINPRGVILNNLTFHNAQGANAFGMMSGEKQERIFFGFSDVNFEIEKQSDVETDEMMKEIIKSRQGWIVAADAPNVYDDPCRRDINIIP